MSVTVALKSAPLLADQPVQPIASTAKGRQTSVFNLIVQIKADDISRFIETLKHRKLVRRRSHAQFICLISREKGQALRDGRNQTVPARISVAQENSRLDLESDSADPPSPSLKVDYLLVFMHSALINICKVKEVEKCKKEPTPPVRCSLFYQFMATLTEPIRKILPRN